MSKFIELCQAFTSARKVFTQYEQECKELAMELWYNMVAYYEIPIDKVSLYNVNTAYHNFEKIASPDDLVLALHQDAYFEFGIGVTLHELPKVHPYPRNTIILPFFLSIDDDGRCKLQFGDQGKDFLVQKGSPASYQPFLDYIFTILKAEYEQGLANMKIQNTVRTIGFKNQEVGG